MGPRAMVATAPSEARLHVHPREHGGRGALAVSDQPIVQDRVPIPAPKKLD